MAEDYSGKSLFNEAGFIIQRLNKLQDEINLVRRNPLLFNEFTQCYNYEIIFANLSSTLNEVWGKLSDTEKDDIEGLRQTILKAIDLLPAHKSTFDANTNKKVLVVDKERWYLIRNNLDILEKKLIKAKDEHGLGNPDMEGDLF